jgi:two-component system, NtrC family, sensor kinase
MVMQNKKRLIEKLTGVHSSKKSYYVALKKKINELLQIKREWETTFSAVTDLLVFINRDYEIQRVNQAAVDFFTMPEKEILSSKCYHLFYGRDTKCNPCIGDQVLASQKTSYLQTRTRYNKVLDIFAYPAFTEEKQPYGVTYYAKDVTRLIDSIKLVSMGEMSAGVAHELNSPLTAIVGNSQLLIRETSPDDPQYQLIKDIHTSGIRCQRIIKNLLTFSRQDEFTFEEIDLNEVVDSSLALAAYQIEKSKIKLIVEKSSQIPKLSGSPNGIEQIVVNLLLNAKDAVEDKMRSDHKSTQGEVRVRTRVHPEGELAIVDISDNGCGIEPEHVPQIFNPFYTTKQSGKGTGLGLSVSLGIAQAHGGFIDLDTTVGQGSTFSLILPLHKAEQCADPEQENN